MIPAIILDGHLKSALTAVRSLGRAGITVSVGAERESAMGLHSRYASHRFVYPSPYADQEGFIAAVTNEALRMGEKPVVYAFSDATYLTLFAKREELKEIVTLVFPEEESIEMAFNKAATYSLARVSGVPTLVNHPVDLKEEVEQLGKTLTFPVVVKPRRSVTWKEGRGVFGSAVFVHTAAELQKVFFDNKQKFGESPLIQDFVKGEEYGVEVIATAGRIIASVVHHRLRSLSPTGGASVLKETVGSGELAEASLSYTTTLISKLSWSGPIMVEFKVDSDSREAKLMEINGRFWGSLPLSVAAGVDMPHLYYLLATEASLPSGVIRHKEGVTTRHFLGDCKHLLSVLVNRDRMRPILYPSRRKALRDFFFLPKGTKSDVWSLTDPKPAMMEIIDAIKNIWK